VLYTCDILAWYSHLIYFFMSYTLVCTTVWIKS